MRRRNSVAGLRLPPAPSPPAQRTVPGPRHAILKNCSSVMELPERRIALLLLCASILRSRNWRFAKALWISRCRRLTFLLGNDKWCTRTRITAPRKNEMLKYVLGVATLFLAINAANAYSYCTEPSAPSCASRYGSFDDEDDFDRCKRQMNNYRSEVESYISCIKNEAEEATRSYNDTVESFNRRARG
jgi:hypothetical protein